MLYGAIAGQSGETGGGGGAGGLPDGAWALADFVSGTYLTTTATLSAVDVVSAPGQVTVGEGLIIDDTSTVELIGDIAALLLTSDWTVVMTWQRTAGFCEPLHIQDSSDDKPRFSLTDAGSYWLAYDLVPIGETISVNERDNEDDFSHSGSSKAAISRTDARLASSFNGRTVVSSGTASSGFAAGVNRVLLGGDSSGSSGEMTLKRLVIYPAQDDSALPGLSI